MFSAIHKETTTHPRLGGLRKLKKNFWSQGLTSLRKFCLATYSQRRHRKKNKISGDHSVDILHGRHGCIFWRRHHSFNYSQGCQGYSEESKFNLKRWYSNSHEFCHQMQHDLCKLVEELFSKSFHERVLGVYMRLEDDKLLFRAIDRKILDMKIWTQRKLLSFCQVSTIL